MRADDVSTVIFDFDGLIVDTETPEFESWSKVFREHGAQLDIDVWATWVGAASGSFDPYAHLEASLGHTIDRASVRKRRRYLFDTLMEAATLRPGVEAYLAKARTRGWKIGLASSGSRDWVVPHLQRYGIYSEFDVIRVRDDVQHAKPDPALYLQVLQALGCTGQETIAFEDSPNGATAARRAGIHCVVVPNGLTSRFTFPDVDYRIESMADMDLLQLVEQLP